MPEDEATPLPLYGLCVGAGATVCADSNGELLRNELGDHSTASLVAFSAEGRQLGSAASMGMSSNAKGTATTVGRMATIPHAQLVASGNARHWQFGHTAAAGGLVEMTSPEGTKAGAVALLGALLGKVRKTSELAPSWVKSDEPPPVAIALLPCVGAGVPPAEAAATRAAAAAALADAAAVGGWRMVLTPSAAEALGAVLVRKWPFTKDDVDTAPKDILVIDMGAHTTLVAVVRLFPPSSKEANGTLYNGPARSEVLAEASDAHVGADAFDQALFDHFAAQIEAKYAGETVAAGTRRGFRLIGACERLRKLLSTLPEAKAVCENLIDGIDVPIAASRDELNALCAAPLGALRALIDGVLCAEDVKAIAAVESLGGGMRMPIVQAVLLDAIAASASAAGSEPKIGAKLDDASIALGTALLGKIALDGATAEAPAEVKGALDADALAALVSAEGALAAADEEAAAKGAVRNALEGYVLSSRGLSSHRKHGGLVDGAKLSPLLDAAEEWLYSEEGETAGLGAMQAELEELKAAVNDAVAAFHAAVQADKEADEKRLEEAAAAAAAERAANGEDEDHDTRKLKFPDRLRLVVKNKEEGTELFQGANYKIAAARYNKALTHAAKFVDLSPDQTTEVNAVKLSCHLNIAQCWLKMTEVENYCEQAIRSCDDALAIDESNVKALYRRATACELKGDYEAAAKYLKKAAAIAPEDKAVPKLMLRVEAQIKRQAAKEKKMYGKMFG